MSNDSGSASSTSSSMQPASGLSDAGPAQLSLDWFAAAPVSLSVQAPASENTIDPFAVHSVAEVMSVGGSGSVSGSAPGRCLDSDSGVLLPSRERVSRRMPSALTLGAIVVESPVGPGTITSFTERGVPRVTEVAVAWLVCADGTVYDPQRRRR